MEKERKINFKQNVFRLMTQDGLLSSLKFSRKQAKYKTEDPAELREANNFVDGLEIVINDYVNEYKEDLD